LIVLDLVGFKLSSNKLLRGGAILTLGQLISYGLSFVRNVILARALTKADFGLAAVFAMTVSLLEVAGRMSFGQQIVQSTEGDSEAFRRPHTLSNSSLR
jgi:O-antigen/teichoic acid export membrane protein